MVLRPGHEDTARRIFEKWELDFAVIGHLTDTGHMVLRRDGAVVADLPIPPLATEAPEYDRPRTPTPPRPPLDPADVPAPRDPSSVLRALMAGPALSSRRWIWEQYDHLVMGDTIAGPGGDAAIVRVHGTRKGLALTSDCTPRYCLADPEAGGAQAVAEAWRNITATGARPLAFTDNMNFGNPERPEIMGQFAGCVEGMRRAALALDFPVVSGNVSLYNETNGAGIMPTPVIGGVGLIDDVAGAVGIGFTDSEQTLVLVGETAGHLGASLYLREIEGRRDGPAPPVDLEAERRNGDLVRALIADGLVSACHDVSDGGLYVAAAEMALAGDIGAALEAPPDAPPLHAWLFGEDQGRYLIATREAAAVLARTAAAGVPARRIGVTGGDTLTVNGAYSISVAELRTAHERWLPAYMAASHGDGGQ